MSPEDRYAQAGVNIAKGNRFVERIAPLVAGTHDASVLSSLGGFSGLVSLDTQHYPRPVLVSATDGVGTKLKIAFLTGIHNTVGIDLVAMSVNDIVVTGARPLLFLDYFSTGKLSLETAEAVVSGIVEGCQRAACSLIGGETAEMPGFYPPGEYDLAGFCVGVANQEEIIDPSQVPIGAALLGLLASGLHSNGYSLVRRIFFDELGMTVDTLVPELGRTVGEELLEPTRIYAQPIMELGRSMPVHALAHITGGGLLENLPRVLPLGARAVIRRDSWQAPPIFSFLRHAGKLSDIEMVRTFNSGLGMVAAVDPDRASEALAILHGLGFPAEVVGEVAPRKEDQDPVEII